MPSEVKVLSGAPHERATAPPARAPCRHARATQQPFRGAHVRAARAARTGSSMLAIAHTSHPAPAAGGGGGGRRAAPRAARLRKAANLQLALARLGCFGVCQSCDHFTALPHADGLRDRALGTLSSRSHEQGVRSSKVCSPARCAQQLLSGVLSSCSRVCSAAALRCAQQLLSRARCAATQPRGLSGMGLRACSSEPRRHFFALDV